jgi:hypothetical protein
MDPYLEEPGLWPDVHHELMSVAREFLNQQVRPKYHVRIEDRVYISDENDPGRQVIIPDLRIAQSGVKRPPATLPSTFLNEAGSAVAEPIELTTLIEDEIHEARLEVIDRQQRTIVTVIELLSPTNKVAGARGRASYLEKRTEVMNSPSHFVEIDLLRGGVPLTARELVPPADYYVHVSRKQRRPKGSVWPILLPQRLPIIPIPLRPEDDDAPLDLQHVLATAYQRAAYDLEVDYGQDPQPPLPETYVAWADELLRVKGLRR